MIKIAAHSAFLLAACSSSPAPRPVPVATPTPVVAAPAPPDAPPAPPPVVIVPAEQPGESDEDAAERADQDEVARNGKPVPVPPLPPGPIPKGQPAQLCRVVGQAIAAAPGKFVSVRTKASPEQRGEDLRVYKSTLQLGQSITVEILERMDGTITWEATWPRRKRSTDVELREVLPILRGCKELAGWTANRYTVEATDGGGKDEIIWAQAAKPTVTLIDKSGDLEIRVKP